MRQFNKTKRLGVIAHLKGKRVRNPCYPSNCKMDERMEPLLKREGSVRMKSSQETCLNEALSFWAKV